MFNVSQPLNGGTLPLNQSYDPNIKRSEPRKRQRETPRRMERSVDVAVSPGTTWPIINASFNNLAVSGGGTLNALVNIGFSAAKELTEAEYEQLLKPTLENWLSPLDYEPVLRAHLGHLSENGDSSATWIFQHDNFLQWQSREVGPKVLWIAGRPGAGKSVLSAGIIRRLRSHYNTFVGYAFSSKTDEARKTTSALIRSIIWQMLTTKDLDLHKKRQIVAVFRREAVDAGDSLAASWRRFDTAFTEYIKIMGKVTLIFDGLDECTEPTEFLKRMLQIASQSSSDLRVIFAGQKTRDISLVLDSKCILVDMDSPAVRSSTDQDIKCYVNAELEKQAYSFKNPNCHGLHGEEDGKIARLILDNLDALSSEISIKANGMFLWAVMAVPDIVARLISSNLDYSELFKSINRLPDNMGDIFMYLLRRATVGDHGLGHRESQKRSRYLLVMLRWVFHAIRPLSLRELQTFIGLRQARSKSDGLEISTGETVSLEFLREVAQDAYPLVVIQDQTLTVLHSSFRDFVHPTSGPVSSSISDTLGSSLLLEDFIELSLLYLETDSFDFELCMPMAKSDLESEYAAYNYTCAAWVSQLKTLPRLSASLQDTIKNFLAGHTALTWLEQWIALNYSPTELQSDLYVALAGTIEPTWCIKLLDKCCRLRTLEDDDAVQTIKMRRELGLAYKSFGMLDAALKEFEAVLGKRPQDCHSKTFNFPAVEFDMASLYHLQGKHELSLQMHRNLIEFYRNRDGDLGQSTLTARAHLGQVLHTVGRIVEAEALLIEVYDKQRQALGERSEATLNTLNSIVICILQQGRFEEGRARAEEEMRLYLQIQERTDSGALSALVNVATAEKGLGNYREALRLEEVVYTARVSKLGANHPKTLEARNNIAGSLAHLGRFSDALQIAKEVYESEKGIFGENSARVLTAAANLAVHLENTTRLEEAISLEEMVLQRRTAWLGELHLETLLSMRNLAISYESACRLEEAQKMMVRAYAGYFEASGELHPYAIACLPTLAGMAHRSWATKLACWLSRVALEQTRMAHGESHPSFASALLVHARIQRLSGHFEEAVAVAKRAKTRSISCFGKSHPTTLNAKTEWALSLRLNGYYQDAETIFSEIRDIKSDSCARDDPSLIESEKDLAVTHCEQGRLDLAIAKLRELRKTAIGKFPPSSVVPATLDIVLADALSRSGMAEEAEGLVKPVVASITKLKGSNSADAARVMESLSECLWRQSRLDEARKLLLRAMAIRTGLTDGDHPHTLTTMHFLSKVLALQGLASDAAALMQIVVDRRRERLRAGHPKLLEAEASLADLVQHVDGTPSLTQLDILKFFEGEQHPKRDAVYHFEQAEEMFGMKHPLTLKALVELGMHHSEKGELQEAQNCLLTVLDVQVGQYGAGNRHALETMVKLGRLSPANLEGPKMIQCVHQAIDIGDASLLRQLLDVGADLFQKDSKTRVSTLGHAVMTNRIELVEEVLKHRVDVNSREESGDTPLHIALDARNPSMVRLLLAHDADPLAQNAQSASALSRASAFGSESLVKHLLEAGAQPVQDPSPIPALHAAAFRGHVGVLSLLAESAMHVNTKVVEGYTPLLAAANSGSVAAMEVLLRHGADPDAITEPEGLSALDVACSNGRVDAVKYLLGRGFEAGRASGGGVTAAHLAAKSGSVSVLQVLLEHGANLDSQTTTERRTPLSWAIVNDQSEVVSWLIDQQVDVNQRLSRGLTPLRLATIRKQAEMVQKLLAAGADPNVVCEDGETALLQAVFQRDESMVELLLAHGAHLMVAGMRTPPLAVALFTRQSEVVEMLLRHDESHLDYQEPNTGFSLMHVACYVDETSLAESLLKRKAPTDLVCIDGGSALHVAVGRRNECMIKLLLSHGARTDIRDHFGRTPAGWAASSKAAAPILELFSAGQHDFGTDNTVLYSGILQAAAKTRIGSAMVNTAAATTLGHALLVAGDGYNATIALELSCAPEAKVVDASCTLCQEHIGDIEFVCTECREVEICSGCHARIAQRELQQPCCHHDSFLRIPRPEWKDWPVGCVDSVGTTVDEWLANTCQRYGKLLDLERA